jgi:hypothetical protein
MEVAEDNPPSDGREKHLRDYGAEQEQNHRDFVPNSRGLGGHLRGCPRIAP